MSTSTTISLNPNYALMLPHVEQIRDVVRGSAFIKAKGTKYLKHPSTVDTTSDEALSRYIKFKDGAEFDDFTASTKRVMLGRMKTDDITFEPPQGLGYLVEDTDKDGLSMKGLAESCVGNVLEVKWHLLLTEYNGLTNLPLDVVPSIQDVQEANPRSTIKQYKRENVRDWEFKRINGAMQITYLELAECGWDTDNDGGSRQQVTSIIKLALDEDGYYYQQKRTDGGVGATADWGEAIYPEAGGQKLKFIPVTLACDEEFAPGEMPMELGFLAPIGELALARYRVSARYKENLEALGPTMFITGVTDNGWKESKEIMGRDYIATGPFAPNFLADETAQVSLLESQASMEQFDKYFEENQNKVKAIGGVFNSDASVQRTATEIINDSETTTAVLIPIANSVESAIKWQIAYCAMFEGLVQPEGLGDYVQDIDFTMPKSFACQRLSTEEVKAMLDVYMAGLMSKEDFLMAFTMGGWSEASVEELLGRLEEGV